MDLPYIDGKTVQTTSTAGWGFNIEKVCIRFTDGTALVLTPDQGYIKVRLEPAATPAQPTPPTAITPRSEWPGE